MIHFFRTGHIYSPMVSLRLTSFPNSFLMKKAHQHDNFIVQLLRLLLWHSKMLLLMRFFKYAVTYLLNFELLFKYFRSSVLQIFFKVSGVFRMVTVAPCFVVIFSMLLVSTLTSLIMYCFYACLFEHFLASIFVGVLECGRFITSLKWNDTSDDTVLIYIWCWVHQVVHFL